MATPAQINANQRNAGRSTGPRTRKGKAIASRNSTRQGLLAQHVILPGENKQLFDARRNAILADLSPVGEVEQVLVERVVACEWRLRRLGQIETSVFRYEIFDHDVRRAKDVAKACISSDYGDMSLIGRTVTNQRRRDRALGQADESAAARDDETLAIAFTNATTKTDTLSKLSRYEAAIERGLYRSLHELHLLQAARQQRDGDAPAVIDVTPSAAMTSGEERDYETNPIAPSRAGTGRASTPGESTISGDGSSDGAEAKPTTPRLSTITREARMLDRRPKNPFHPGEILLEEFLEPMGLSQAAFAQRIGWTRPRLNELIRGKRGITAEAALDLAETLGTSSKLWMNLQATYDLDRAAKARRVA